MTTIATDGKTMAGDGLVTGGSMRHFDNAVKVGRTKDGRLYGFAGSLYDAHDFIDFLEGGNPKPQLSDDFEGLVILQDGSCICVNSKAQTAPSDLPAVVGSGGCYALAAMHAGKTPREAVEIACRLDSGSGGEIATVVLDEGV